ncbi:MAG: c-type cytochrome [Pirellulaceae bacterium]|jgi:mono/diheme cytochrome c family protein|nr:c-type cytochrome [Pirellulaceae bacterium]
MPANVARLLQLPSRVALLMGLCLTLLASGSVPIAPALADDPAAQAAPGEVPGQPTQEDLQHARQLYLDHCAGCHGENGGGLSVASQYLFPRPRDLRAGKFRLVSTQNNVPSRQDLHSILLRGMPGSSMPPWGHLSLADREALVDEVYRLRAEGARDEYVKMLREIEGIEDDELEDEDVQQEIADFVKRSIVAGASSEVPKLADTDPASIARGHEQYLAQGCAQCHGNDGKGESKIAMFDAENMPSTARDFTLGIFKGGDDPSSLYRRIVYGMPGSPMPSSNQLTPAQVNDLVNFIRSLSTEEQRKAAVLNRETILAKRIRAKVPVLPDSNLWTASAPVRPRVVPLWWRNGVNPELSIQALHDGTTLAVRLTWRDNSENQQALRTSDFEDAIAMQLFDGENEPFLGMGNHQSPVDIWYWDANRQTLGKGYQEPYPNEVVDRYPLTEGPVVSLDIDRPGARLANQSEVSLPALASGNPIETQVGDSGASSLAAAGPGSATFRFPQSRLVVAQGVWRKGEWSVVMTRPLLTKSDDDGVSLKPGARVSAAFALWDGAHQDRASKKSITIWQDLKLEQ